jgi:hypothetical protein
VISRSLEHIVVVECISQIFAYQTTRLYTRALTLQ